MLYCTVPSTFNQRRNGGDVADDVSTIIKHGGAAAAGCPVGADVDAQKFQFIRRARVTPTARQPVKTVHNTLAEVAILSERIAQAIGGVARRHIFIQRQGRQVAAPDSEDGCAAIRIIGCGSG